jgi:hypothetical protein
VSGVPFNFELLLFIDVLLHWMPQIVIFFNQLRLPPIFLRPEDCREPKRLKNTALERQ